MDQSFRFSETYGLGIKTAMPFFVDGKIEFNYSVSEWVHEGALTNGQVLDHSEDVITAKKMLDLGYTVNTDKTNVDYIWMEEASTYCIFNKGKFMMFEKETGMQIFDDTDSFLVVKEVNNLLTESVLKWMGFEVTENKDVLKVFELDKCIVYLDNTSGMIHNVSFPNGVELESNEKWLVREFVSWLKWC